MATRWCSWATGYDHTVARDRTTAVAAWASGTTYALDALCHDNAANPNRAVYKSLQAGNQNHALSDGAWWAKVADGTYTLPYQSPDSCVGLTGGDFCYLEASPAPTDLGTAATWTAGSTTVTFTGVDLTGSIAAYDFLTKNATCAPGDVETCWEVASRAYTGGNTVVTLAAKYSGATGSATTYKLGTTDTGTAASSSTNVQSVASAGTSAASVFTIQGGYTLATQTRDGATWFRQTGATKNGRGVHDNASNFADVANVGCLRYSIGLNFAASGRCTATSCTTNSSGSYGIVFSGANCTATSCTANFNTNHGIYLAAVNCSATSCTANNNTTAGIYCSGSLLSRAQNLTQSGNGAVISVAVATYSELPMLGLTDPTLGQKWFYEYGTAQMDTTNYRGASGACWALLPTSTIYYICSYERLRQWQTGGSNVDLCVWAKMESGFDGDCQLEAWYEGLCIVAAAITLSTSYQRFTITALAADLPRAGYVELRVRVRRGATSGKSIYLDDFMAAT